MIISVLPWFIIFLVNVIVIVFVTIRGVSDKGLTIKIPAGILDFIIISSLVLLSSFCILKIAKEEVNQQQKAQVEQNEK